MSRTAMVSECKQTVCRIEYEDDPMEQWLAEQDEFPNTSYWVEVSEDMPPTLLDNLEHLGYQIGDYVRIDIDQG